MGLGILTKGPVAVLHVLPVALLAPWWWSGSGGRTRMALDRRRWYGGVALAVLVATLVALAWAVPTAIAGGEAFRREIFWHQSADRIATTAHHLQPFWFYVAMLPVLALPWLFVPAAWRAGLALLRFGPSPGVRFVLAWGVPVFLAFSAFRGKQVQYLLPEVPAIAFLLAAGLVAAGGRIRRVDLWALAAAFAALSVLLLVLAQQPTVTHLVPPESLPALGWSVAALLLAALGTALAPWRDGVRAVAVIGSASVLAMAGLYAGFGRVAFDVYDLHPVSQHLGSVQQAGLPVAHSGKYHGQFQFIGRLTRPLAVVEGRQPLLVWAAAHPQGRVVLYSRRPLTHDGGAQAAFGQKFKGGFVEVWRATDLPGVSDGWYRPRDDAE
jgi:4-amino-4-deoxy-L-arabinose transferase-like glycosyltransferase